MPRKRLDRLEEERQVYNALLELIPGCRDVYNKAGKKIL
jgi:hypothetical protein